MTTETIDQRADRLVRQEVLCCVSALVQTLANGVGSVRRNPSGTVSDLSVLCDQAFELASPIEDYEEAAMQAGWGVNAIETIPNPEGYLMHPGRWHEAGNVVAYETARECCEGEDIPPYEREAFEHWAVSDFLARELEAKGERVDHDFAGLCVWGRTTCGQALSTDCVIRAIANELLAS